jgi:hypothetical protein
MRSSFLIVLALSVHLSLIVAQNCNKISADGRSLFNLNDFANITYNISIQSQYGDHLQISLCQPNIGCNQESVFVSVYNADASCYNFGPETPIYTPADPTNITSGINITNYNSDSSDDINGILTDDTTFETTLELTDSEYTSLSSTEITDDFFGFESVTVSLLCDPTVQDVQAINWTVTYDQDELGLPVVTLTGGSAQGCAYATLNEFIAFLGNNGVIFIALYTICGLIICFQGYRKTPLIVFMVGSIISLFVFATVIMDLFPGDNDWTIFSLCLILAFVVGYIGTQFDSAHYTIIGICFGIVGAMFLYDLFSPLTQGTGSNILYTFAVIVGGMGAFIGWRVREAITVLSTSFIGSFLYVRALSLFLGTSFPTEYGMAVGFESSAWEVYLYLLIILVCTFTGIRTQTVARNLTYSDEEDTRNLMNPVQSKPKDGKYSGYTPPMASGYQSIQL